jgi:SAM-dependent methyltransferase
VDDAVAERWSRVAEEWNEYWGRFAMPAWRAIAEATGITAGSRVLDVGCGAGGFLGFVARHGAVPSGIDPAAGMVRVARASLPGLDVRVGSAEDLPWADHSFDVVTAVNALQFSDDQPAAIAEAERVVVRGGLIAVANWAETTLNELERIEDAVSLAANAQPVPDGPLRLAGGLERLFVDAGLQVVDSGLVAVPWSASDDDSLVRGILFDEDDATRRAHAATVIEAAQPFRTLGGGYSTMNAFRWAVARTRA